MQFRQSAQRDDRRRRVLTDEVLGDPAVSDEPDDAAPSRRPPRSARTTARRYTEAALMDGQPRLTDLIPQRIITLVLWFLGGIALIAGLEAGYAYMPELAKKATDGRVEALDLDGEGSLAVWFSSALLSLAGLTALVTYAVRRQRMDDYHGRYRIWLWAAMCWFLMSLDETASLHEGFKEMMSHATGQRLMGDGSLWWVMPYMLLLGVVGTSLLLEMRASRWATALFILTAVSYAVAVVAQLGWIMPESGARGVMVEEGCEMLGHLLLLLTMAVYARHVIRDAQGLVPERAAKPAKKPRKERKEKDAAKAEKSAAEKSSEPAGKRTTEPVKATTEPAKKPAIAAGSSQITVGGNKLRVDQPDEEDEDDGGRQRMSKAERKALRRQQQEERNDRYR